MIGQKRLERSSQEYILGNETTKQRHFIASSARYMEVREIYKHMQMMLPSDLFRVKRIRKPVISYLRISIAELAGAVNIRKTLESLRLGMGVNAKEVSLFNKPTFRFKAASLKELRIVTININGLKNSLEELKVIKWGLAELDSK